MRRSLLAALAIATLISGCGIDGQTVRVGHLPLCDHTNTGRLILMAQSVPTAQVIPCIDEQLPDGWKLEHADAETGRSRLQFDNEAGVDVVVHLLPSCTPTGESQITLWPGIESFQVVDESGRVDEYVFAGGCIRLEVPRGDDPDRMADAIGFLFKDELRAGSGWELPD